MIVARWVKGFALFWWDFIVGDSMVLAAGTLIAVGLAFLLVHEAPRAAVEVVLPLTVGATLGLSLLRR